MQGILGTTSTKPLFHTKLNSDNTIDIYFGMAKISTIPNNKKSMLFKSTISILVSAGVCISHIEENFNISFKSIKKYAEIFKNCEDDILLEKKLKNPGREVYKITDEVYDFIHQKASYYESIGKIHYHKKIISDVMSEYNIKLVRSTIRLTLKKTPKKNKKTDNENNNKNFNDENSTPPVHPIIKKDIPQTMFRNNYAGLLLLSPFLQIVLHDFPMIKTPDEKYLLKTVFTWWMLSFLLEAKNFERQRYFIVEDFEFISGYKSFPTVETMRKILYKQSLYDDTQATTFVLKKNIDYFVEEDTNYYLDPHFEKYTGKENITKCWSTLHNRVCKGIFDNFVHDSSGNPIFSVLMDNFYDFREIIVMILDKIRKIRPLKPITLIYDRGGFGVELMEEISSKKDQYFITWQKGFKQTDVEEHNLTEKLEIAYPYNDLGKFKFSNYTFGEDIWKCKNYECRRIIFQKENDNGDKFYQSVLTNDTETDGSLILEKILKRSLQENDFKKQKTHFGLDEITSYRKLNYNKLGDKDPNKETDNIAYKKKLKEIRELKNTKMLLINEVGKSTYEAYLKEKILSKLLKENKKILREIEEIEKEIENQNILKKEIEKKISKLEQYQNDDKVELDLRCKRILEILKLTSRNIFEKGAKDFLNTYGNLRDYQKVFHTLVNTGGQILIDGNIMYVEIDPIGRKNFKKKCNEYFEILNQKKLTSINGKYILQFKCFPI